MDNTKKSVVTAITALIAYLGATFLLQGLGGNDNALLVATGAVVMTIATLLNLGLFAVLDHEGKKKKKKPESYSFDKVSIFLLIATLAITIPFATASTPEYLITTEINTELNNTQNHQLGRLIISPQPHTPTIITANNFTSLTAQRFDQLTWTNNQHTISVTPPTGNPQTVVSGGSYAFTNTGTHTYQALGDPSLQGTINVGAAPTLTFSIFATAGDLPVTVSPSSFTLGSQDRVVNLTVNVPRDYPPSTFPLRVVVDTNFRDQTINRTLTLSEITRWEVLQDTLPETVEVSGGDTEEIGLLLVSNEGNINFDVTTTLTGPGSDYLQTQSRQTLFRNTNSQFDIRARIPSTQADGEYPVTITLSGGGQTFAKNLTVIVKDLTPPVVGNVTFVDPRAQRNTSLRVLITDNIGVESANFSVPSLNLTLPLSQDNQLWLGNILFPTTAPYGYVVCASDASNNTACVNGTHTPAPLDIITPTRSIQIPSIRHGSFTNHLLFNLTEKPPAGITVRLESFTPSTTAPEGRSLLAGENSYYHIRLVDGDGSFHRFTSRNSTVTVFEPGPIYVQVRASPEAVRDRRTSYSGSFLYETPPYHVSKPSTSFEGVFVDYNLPQPFRMNWGTGGEIDCRIIDTGSLETSQGECTLVVPAQDLDRELLIPITRAEKNFMEQQLVDTREEYEQRLMVRNILVGVFLAVGLVLLLFHLYAVHVKPRLVFIKNW